MQQVSMDRRLVVGLLRPTCLSGPGFTQEGECEALQRARHLAQACIDGVGVWVATDAPFILFNAQAKLTELKAAMPEAGDMLDDARRSEFLDLIGLLGGSTLLIVGIVGAPAATLILAGLALSSGLLIAGALTATNTLDPQETVALQIFGYVERSLTAAGSAGLVAARSAANIPVTLTGGATTIYSLMVWLNSLNGTVVAEEEFDDLLAEIATIEAELSPLDDPDTMQAVRLDSMTALHGELSAFPCTVLD